MKHYKKQNGYAILIVLIAIAILLILYAVQMKALFVPQNLPKQSTGIQQRPWLLEDLLVPEGEVIKLPRSPKPQLAEPIQLNAGVKREDIDRGTAVIHLETNGRVRAAWKTEYVQNEQPTSITAEMNGNINIKQTYEDQNGTDKSRLFFIAKGSYQKTADTLTGGADEKGAAYILGWLKPDHTAHGYITITTDEKWSAVYEWTILETEK